MQEDIFSLLMLILLMQCGGGSENLNQLIIMFMLMQNRSGSFGSSSPCDRDNGYTF